MHAAGSVSFPPAGAHCCTLWLIVGVFFLTAAFLSPTLARDFADLSGVADAGEADLPNIISSSWRARKREMPSDIRSSSGVGNGVVIRVFAIALSLYRDVSGRPADQPEPISW